MITLTEFARRMVGVPWVKWRADWQACDCYGLLVMYYRHVLGQDIGQVPHAPFATGLAGLSQWRECPAGTPGEVYVFTKGSDPQHCGVPYGFGRVLHCWGSDNHPGNVRIDRLDALTRLYGGYRTYAHHP